MFTPWHGKEGLESVPVRRSISTERSAFAKIAPQIVKVNDLGSEQRFVNYNELVDRVVDVFGDEIAASRWLSSPNADFEQKTPIDVAREHEYDRTVLEPVLIRIEHGVYF